MVVIYAEKPSLAKTIAEVLEAGKRIPLETEPTICHYEFTFKGEAAVICHGIGHLCGLNSAKSYGEDFEKWDLNKYPCIPDEFSVCVKEQTKKCFNLVKSYFQKADWLINATDADREGELIFGYVYQMSGCNKPWKRLWIEDLTDEKLINAFNNLKDSTEVLPLQEAGRARDIADWLIGINLTLAATKKFGGTQLMPIGRVQTPTLAMVVNREKAILNHVKKPFWKLSATFKTDCGEFSADHENGKFEDEETAKQLLANCKGNQGVVVKKEVKSKTVSAPLLFNTTQLLAEANKKFGWNAKKATQIIQGLYEKKYLSYPRTSSEHLTEAMKPEVKETISRLIKLPEYSDYFLSEGEWTEFSKRHFDDTKVESHTALIPTLNVPENLDNFSDDERKIYDLCAKSLIRIIFPKVEEEETTVILDVNSEKFKAHGVTIVNKGWYMIDGIPDKKKALPVIEDNKAYDGEYSLNKGETEPPKRYTEADLLEAMELAGQKLEDEEARTLMKLQKKGLGTAATRGTIINGLFEKELLALKGKSIVPTEKGIFLIDSLQIDDLKSAEITGDWEKQLNDISLDKFNSKDFIQDIKDTTRKFYNDIVSSDSKSYVSGAEKDMLCPLCHKPVHKTKWGYGCSGYKDGCKFAIGNEICGKKITEAQVMMLINNGKTKLIKGFTSKKGNTFNAYLKVNKDTGKIDMEFEQNNK